MKRLLAVAATLILATLFAVPSPASAHGGDGRSAGCNVSGARVASWGCGTGYSTSGDSIFLWWQDSYNDGHCVRAFAQNSARSRTFYLGQACALGSVRSTVRTIPTTGEWSRIYISTPHRYMTICGAGSGRSC